MKNCKITVIEYLDTRRTNNHEFHFDDYRVATAITNLLLNIEGVEHHSYYKTEGVNK